MEENNTVNNMEGSVDKKKNNSAITIIIIILILAIIAIIVYRKTNLAEQPLSQSEVELNQTLNDDSTASISTSLNNINLDDTSSEDLKEVDKELGNL